MENLRRRGELRRAGMRALSLRRVNNTRLTIATRGQKVYQNRMKTLHRTRGRVNQNRRQRIETIAISARMEETFCAVIIVQDHFI